jgi:hypothetical protein
LAVAPKNKTKSRNGRRRSSQLVRLGLRNDPGNFQAELRGVAGDTQANQRKMDLRKAGVRDFSDFRIFHAIAGVRSAISKVVRAFTPPAEPRR